MDKNNTPSWWTAPTRFARRWLIADAAPMAPAEIRRSALAALLGVLIYACILLVLPLGPDARRQLAPLGASAVILFTLPHSPLAQPWSVAGGLLLPGLMGLGCGTWIANPVLAAGLALGLAVGCMGLLRCIHPPGGAMALVMAGAAAQGLDPFTSLGAVLANVLAMLAAALVVNNLVPGRRYPLCAPPRPTPAQARAPMPTGIRHPDLAAALEELGAYLDVSEEDLEQLFNRATHHAFQRQVLVECRELMEPPGPALEFATPLNTAWALLRRHNLSCLPVLDRHNQRLLGLLGLEDFLRHVAPDDGRPIGEPLRRLLRPTPESHSSKPEVAGQLMLTPALGLACARLDTSLADGARLLAEHTQPVLPVLDEHGRLAGLITRPRLTRALYQHQALDRASHTDDAAD